MKKLILSSFALAAFLFVSNSASAQDPTSTLAVTLPPVMTLSADNSALSAFTFTVAELTAGKVLSEAVTLNYTSNKKTYVNISATPFKATGITDMPADIVQFSTSNSFDTNTPKLTGTPQLLSGAVGAGLGNERGTGSIKVSYKLTPTLDYEPAAYSSTITYTITGN